MGQGESVPSCQELRRNEQGDFVVISNSLPDTFSFLPAESHAIGYGIDRQSAPEFKKKSLTFITVDDAKQVLDAFVKVGAVCRENARIFSASGDPEKCTAEGMKTTFQEAAKRVGENGLFVFHFSGHGIKVRNDMWGLAPMDFDYSSTTYITASVLCHWLNEAECHAKYILITLDCCYAGGIGKELATQAGVERSENLFVLSACTANETSLVLASLGHSIFTYFLSEFVLKFGSKESGVLPMKKIFSECQVCCESLSSLLVSYSKESGLQLKVMQPQIAVRNIVSEGEDSTDSAEVPIGRFQFVQELYDYGQRIAPLDDKSLAYLDSIRDSASGPLFQLVRRDLLLRKKIIMSVFCSIMYSLASIELACDDSANTKVRNLNLSITAFMNAASAIDMVYQGVQCDGFTFLLSWLFYKEVIRKNNVNMRGMKELEAKLKQQYMTSPKVVLTSRGGEDMTDSDEVETVLVSDFESLKEWIPLSSPDSD